MSLLPRSYSGLSHHDGTSIDHHNCNGDDDDNCCNYSSGGESPLRLLPERSVWKRTSRQQLSSKPPHSKSNTNYSAGLIGSAFAVPLSSTTMTTAGKQQNSMLLWTFLSVSLLFCFLDVLYIMKYVMQQHDDVVLHSVTTSITSTDRRTVVQGAASRKVQTLPSDWSGSDKEPILKLLQEALGDSETVDPETVARLPTAQEVTDLYGSEPVVLGLETCERFQAYGDPAEHFVSTAGTFNTGTNLMAELLIANCVLPARMQKYQTKGVRWQVVWGKHTPVHDEHYRQTHRTYNDTFIRADNMFPAVTVRDPFKWMQSMCRHSYGADWPHDPAHCPNLIPNEVDRELLLASHKRYGAVGSTMNVTVSYADFQQHHASLVSFWNDWYKAYVEAPFPRLIVRFEDVVFHPKQITKIVCECAGGQLNSVSNNKPFRYIVDSAKRGAAHGAEKTSYVDALVKYGTEAGRYTGFETADLAYARQHLNPALMRLFGYRYPPPSTG